MIFVANDTNNPLGFARGPDWQVMLDLYLERATATCKALLDRAAVDKLRLHFLHVPFPATGYVDRNGAGYEYLPAPWE